ncbi:unnamed protein product [Arabidopsis thaliana]|uniref:(thale cress) hypothetical protein n=1 Tax=Arabidopsis thaliana TaxID=3702 RepID=A0A7G2EXZ6_ARATH|nr:unnamed protein product [Arabidopsis thaliana]
MFIQMRRHIEEVNLYVTVVQHTISSCHVDVADKNFNSEDTDESDYDSEEELHQFALDSALVGPTQEQTSATTETEQRRKGIMDPIGKTGKAGPRRASVTDSSSDNDYDLLLVPFTMPPIHPLSPFGKMQISKA